MRRVCALVLVLALAPAGLVSSACLTTMSPRSVVSLRQRLLWQREQVKLNLDRLRDVAISLEASTPQLLSEAVATQVILFHKSMLTVVSEGPFGWQQVVKTALEQLHLWLGNNDRLLLGPYMDLVKLAVEESQPQARDPVRER